jgi:hypothetical protein
VALYVNQENYQNMKIYFLLLLNLLTGVFICNAQKQVVSISFPKPDGGVSYYSPKFKAEAAPHQIGVAKIGDPFDAIKFPRMNVSVIDNEDSIAQAYDKQKENLTVLVDNNQEITQAVHFYQRFKYKRYFSVPKDIRSINKTDTLSIPLIKDTSLTFKALPVYIANLTDSDIIIRDIGGSLDIVEEAMDKNKKWIAIEKIGSSHFGIAKGYTFLKPRQFLICSVLKYRGAFKTKLRVRFTVKDQIYYSKPFDGSINYAQIKSPMIKKIHGKEYEL